jgi:hypothetical protein
MKRRAFLGTLASAAALSALPAWAIGDSSKLQLARLEYDGGNWKTRNNALRRILYEVEKRSSIAVALDASSCRANTPALFDSPFLVWSGNDSFDALSQEASDQLGIFIRAGGFILVDDAQDTPGPFAEAVRNELSRCLPELSFSSVDPQHVLYKAFYLIDKPWGRRLLDDQLQALELDGRLAVVYTPNDLQGALEKDDIGHYVYDVDPGGEDQREYAIRFAINLVMYAFCQTYKDDQVHVPFILKRRQWRID